MMKQDKRQYRISKFSICLSALAVASLIRLTIPHGHRVGIGVLGNETKKLNNGDASKVGALEFQIKLQSDFQELIYRNQHPVDCSSRRVLLTPRRPERLDGFCLELQWWGRHLQASVAVDRTFVMRNNFISEYAPPGCQWSTINMTVSNAWECLFHPITNCTEQSITQTGSETKEGNVMGSYGIHNHEFSKFFHTGFYGNKRIVHVLKERRGGWPAVDSIEHWERAMGRFWIRSQMVHYMWKPSIGLQSEVDKRIPKSLLQSNTPFIGMHIRFTDNVVNLWNDFSRNANLTRSLSHFMDIAQKIRSKTGISTVYLATDSIATLEQLQNSKYPEWKFVVQENVPRSSGTEWTWFRNIRTFSGAAIATDLEVLRRADYLIGSFQSNVYRLATELNTAYNYDRYLFQQERHMAVDVPWYEDP
jgi:Alpha-(1,6)-fucosyltransferase N- and catalytic domains